MELVGSVVVARIYSEGGVELVPYIQPTRTGSISNEVLPAKCLFEWFAADYAVNVTEGNKLRGLADGANIGWIKFEINGDPRINLNLLNELNDAGAEERSRAHRSSRMAFRGWGIIFPK